MDEEEEKTKEILEKANMILSYIFSLLNIIILIISFYILRTKTKNLIFLKYKLFALIIIDSISSLLYINYRQNLNLFFSEILFSILMSVEFYLFLSFIYQIFNSTEMSQNSKGIGLINSLQLCLLFLLQIFSYHKFSYLYSQILNIIQRIINFVCLILFYRYLKNAITTINVRLMSKDLQNRKVYYYLKISNVIGLIFFLCNTIIQLIYFSIKNESYQMYVTVIFNSINYGFKYFIFILFEVIIYTLGKDYFKNNTDEQVNIFQNK